MSDIFKNVDNMRHITCPLLIIHGTKDEVVHIKQGKALFKAAIDSSSKRFIEREGMTHSEFSMYDDVTIPIRGFMIENGLFDIYRNKLVDAKIFEQFKSSAFKVSKSLPLPTTII